MKNYKLYFWNVCEMEFREMAICFSWTSFKKPVESGYTCASLKARTDGL